MLDDIPDVNVGDPITAEFLTAVARRCNREITGDDYFADEFGVAILGGQGDDVRLRRFEMTPALSLGESATVEQVFWDGSAYTTEPGGATAVEFDVYDFQEKFSKPVTTSGADGAFGIARYWPDRAKWEILTMNTPSILRATLKGDLADTDATATVDTVTRVQGYCHVLDATEEVTAQNIYDAEGSDDGLCHLHWNEVNENWELWPVACP